MKASYVAVAGVLLGTALGAGLSWARFGHSAPLQLASSTSPVRPGGQASDQPKVSVDERSYDFGPVERDRRVRHVFRFTNVGGGILTLKAGSTTCSKCTIAELSKSEASPGETVEVTVEYLTSTQQPHIRQEATILTNDPDQRQVRLTIFGSVTARYDVVPPTLVLSKASTSETTKAQIKIQAFLSDEVAVVGHELLDAESAPYFDVQSQAIPREQLAGPEVKSGCRVEVTIKPGLPLGPIRQTIRLKLHLAGFDEEPTVDVPVEGIVDSDISLVGRGWIPNAGKLVLGEVKAAEGAKRGLLVVVRGEHRFDVAIKPSKVDPPWLKVTLGQPADFQGAAIKIPLTIEIPPGMSPVNRLGSEQAKFGEVVLETTHPDVKQIRLYLQFVIVP